MSHPENHHHQTIILDLADEPVIAYAVFLELAQRRSVQRFSDAAWVVEFRYALVKELQDSFPVLRVQFAEFPAR